MKISDLSYASIFSTKYAEKYFALYENHIPFYNRPLKLDLERAQLFVSKINPSSMSGGKSINKKT